MGQNSTPQRKIRVLISTKEETFNKLSYGFIPITQSLIWDVGHFFLRKNYSSLVKQDQFRDYLQSLQIENRFGKHNPLITDINNPGDVFESPSFIEQFIKGNNAFLSKLQESNLFKTHFRQNKDGSIWIVPVFSHYFNPDNINYTESLVSWASDEDIDLFLLLHDKDLYTTDRESQKVTSIDSSWGLHENSCLKKMINEGRVFVFKHQPDEDVFCKNIVWNKELSTLTSEAIMNTLQAPEIIANNMHLSESVGSIMDRSALSSAIDAEAGGCDFSFKFLD